MTMPTPTQDDSNDGQSMIVLGSMVHKPNEPKSVEMRVKHQALYLIAQKEICLPKQ